MECALKLVEEKERWVRLGVCQQIGVLRYVRFARNDASKNEMNINAGGKCERFRHSRRWDYSLCRIKLKRLAEMKFDIFLNVFVFSEIYMNSRSNNETIKMQQNDEYFTDSLMKRFKYDTQDFQCDSVNLLWSK